MPRSAKARSTARARSLRSFMCRECRGRGTGGPADGVMVDPSRLKLSKLSPGRARCLPRGGKQACHAQRLGRPRRSPGGVGDALQELVVEGPVEVVDELAA